MGALIAGFIMLAAVLLYCGISFYLLKKYDK